MLEIRAGELAPGGRFIAALPASPAPDPERSGLYVELIGDMNRVLADWRRAGRIGADTVAAIVVPVWMRTLDEIREPFEAGGGSVAGLVLENAELFRLDNPYWDDDPAVIAREYVRSVLAWGSRSCGARSRGRARTEPGTCRRLPPRAGGPCRARPRPRSPGLHRGPGHLPQGGRHPAQPDTTVSVIARVPSKWTRPRARRTASAPRRERNAQRRATTASSIAPRTGTRQGKPHASCCERRCTTRRERDG
jgi:hypothetical protein